MSVPAASRRFISLKWQTLGWVSAALALIHIALVGEGYREAMTEFASRQALAFEGRVNVLARLIDQSAARLGRVSGIVPGVIQPAVGSRDFQERWQAMQLELQLEVMQLYEAGGGVVVPGVPLWKSPPEELQRRIATALQAERPASFLLCAPDCVQYVLTPLLGPKGEHRLMVVGVSIADVVLDFPGLSGADVALLVPRVDETAPAYWGRYRLAAISDAPRNEPKIRALGGEAAIEEVQQGHGLSFSGRSYRFYAQPLAAFNSVTPGYFLVFGDTTEALSDIRAQVLRQLLAGLTALLAALALLLSILNRPMNQLRKLAHTLPLLAQSQYAPVRDVIGVAWQRKRSHTEIDVLEEVSVELSRRLEALEQTVASRSQALAEKVAELKRANELNEKIFSTAPMIFLIQSQDGRILQINTFGSQLLGYSETEMQGQPFLSLLADARQRTESGDRMADIFSGRRAIFEQTGPVKCVDGSLERITWLHTRLASQSGNFVLSVGLPDKSLQEPDATAHP
jgi:PAS domain S-box-containing protein